MKISKANVTEDKAVEINSASLVTKEDNITDGQNKGGTIIISLLPILSVIAAALACVIKGVPNIETAKISILTLMLTAASVFYIRLQKDELLNRAYSKIIITAGYLISIILIMLPIRPEVFSFWMIGGMITAMLVDSKLGLLFYFNLTFILSISLNLHPEEIIHFMVMGVLISLLAGALKQKSTVIYAAVILLSTNVTLSFVINNFVIGTKADYNYLSSFFSIFAVILTAFLFSLGYERLVPNYEDISLQDSAKGINGKLKANPVDADIKASVMVAATSAEDLKIPGMVAAIAAETENSELSIESIEALQYEERESRTSCELLAEEDNELLLKLKDFSGELYSHCLRIGDLSGRAARLIDADYLLARAGGLYHEIGKMNGKNYIDEGLAIAEEYSFPKELKTILRQHNIKYDKPTSVEAAIVMLSDNIESTIEYIKKTGDKKFTSDKIIDNIFQMRVDKGTFDESGLSVKDYKILKNFYQEEFRENI